MSLETDPVHAIPAQKKLSRSRSLWRLIAFVAIALVLIVAVGRFAMPGAQQGEDHIARLVINGVITTNPERLQEIEDMAEDDTVKGVIVAINSPGGSTAGGEELYEALRYLSERKPVVATVAELGASAAYMTAIAADEIITRRLSIVLSVGVYYQHYNAGKLLDTIGIDFDKVQTGPLKAEPDIDDPLAGPARQSLQELVNDSFEWFVDIVADRRDMDRDRVLEFADGRIITGRQAVDEGFMDGIGGEREAVEWLETEREVETDLPIYTHYPYPPQGWDAVFDQVGGRALSALGFWHETAIALDGLVSLWQVDATN